jgi:hypothetical protein
MAEMIAICGLDCSECGAFQATRDDDDEKRAETAKLWSELYGAEIKPVDINCTGCVTEGKIKFHHCTVCEIRKCGTEKGVENCAHCEEYACDRLKEFFRMAPECKASLDAIHARL